MFRSPLASKLVFTGQAQIRALSEVIREAVTDLRDTDEVPGESAGFLVWRGRIGGQDIEGVDQLRFRPDGKIQEATAFFRPLPSHLR